MWQLHHWENCRLLIPNCLECWSESRYPVPLLSPSPALIWNHTPGMAAHTDPLLVHFSAADGVQGDKQKIFATVEKSPPPQLLKRPLGIMRFDTVISRLWRTLCFSDVIYLVLCWHPVMMTCHSSLFCALYLYMIRLLFHCITLDLSPILLCHTCN